MYSWLESFRIGNLKEEAEPGGRVHGLPEFSMEEVHAHDSDDKGVWVTYREGVYDITKFIPEHPGKIKMQV